MGRGQRVSQSPAVLGGSLSRQRQLLAPIRNLSREARAGWVNILGTMTFPTNKMPAYKDPGDLDFGAALMPSHKQGTLQPLSRGEGRLRLGVEFCTDRGMEASYLRRIRFLSYPSWNEGSGAKQRGLGQSQPTFGT